MLRQQTSQCDCCARSNRAKDLQIAGMSIRSSRVVVWPKVPSLEEKSLVVVPRSVNKGGMIEIHIKYHRLYSSGIVRPRPITKARQMCVQTKTRQLCAQTKARQMQSKRNLDFFSYTRLECVLLSSNAIRNFNFPIFPILNL